MSEYSYNGMNEYKEAIRYLLQKPFLVMNKTNEPRKILQAIYDGMKEELTSPKPVIEDNGRPTIGVDWDDVLAPLNEVALQIYNRNHYTNHKIDYVVSWEQAESMFRDIYHTKELYDKQIIPCEAIDFIRDLEKVFDVYIITSPFKDIYNIRKRQIKQAFPELSVNRIIVTDAKAPYEFDYLIDDNIGTIRASRAKKKFLFTQPWNSFVEEKMVYDTSEMLADKFKKKNQWFIDPKVGDTAFFTNDSGKITHSGYVYKINDSVICIQVNYIDNISGHPNPIKAKPVNQIYTRDYPKIAGYGRPYDETNDYTRVSTLKEVLELVMEKPKRPSKDEYYLSIAEVVARRSTCLKRQYGAVIVNNDEIISTGYNGSARGEVNCCDLGSCKRMNVEHNSGNYADCHSVHAEQNAIISASRKDSIGSTLYLFGTEFGKPIKDASPCPICKRMIQNAGIKKVVTITDILLINEGGHTNGDNNRT